MSLVAQLIANGLITGAIYTLIAAGFSLIFNTLKFIDLSSGAFFTVGAFLCYTFSELLGLNFILSIILSLIGTALVAVLVQKTIFMPLIKKKASSFIMLIASFGVFLFISGLILLIFNAEVKTFNIPNENSYSILGAYLTSTQIWLIVISIIVFLGLYCFMKYSKIGKAIRAVSDNKEVASTLGINFEKIVMITYVISSLLAGIAGILVALEQNLEYNMGFEILKGIVASVVGGIGNISAAIIGGFFIGLSENIGTWFISSGYKDAIGFIILILFLLFRPQGFFGSKRREDTSG